MTTKSLKLDVKDKKLLVLLSENSRLTLSELSKHLQLGQDTTRYRLQRLKKHKVITTCYPAIDFGRLGFQKFRVFFVVDERRPEKRKAFIDALIAHPNTRLVMEYSDRWDFEWALVAKTLQGFDKILHDVVKEHEGVIQEKITLAEIRAFRATVAPYEYKFKLKEIPHHNDYKHDEKDLHILSALSEDSRLSTYKIAETVDLSADAIGKRIKKLRACRLIKSFRVLVSFGALGYNLYTVACDFHSYDKSMENTLRTYIKEHPNFIGAHKHIGPHDFILRMIAKDQTDFHEALKDLKRKFADVIFDYDMYLAYKQHCFVPVPQVILESAK
jgi:DNA-binding Lrp family transcriptional regulator